MAGGGGEGGGGNGIAVATQTINLSDWSQLILATSMADLQKQQKGEKRRKRSCEVLV